MNSRLMGQRSKQSSPSSPLLSCEAHSTKKSGKKLQGKSRNFQSFSFQTNLSYNPPKVGTGTLATLPTSMRAPCKASRQQQQKKRIPNDTHGNDIPLNLHGTYSETLSLSFSPPFLPACLHWVVHKPHIMGLEVFYTVFGSLVLDGFEPASNFVVLTDKLKLQW